LNKNNKLYKHIIVKLLICKMRKITQWQIKARKGNSSSDNKWYQMIWNVSVSQRGFLVIEVFWRSTFPALLTIEWLSGTKYFICSLRLSGYSSLYIWSIRKMSKPNGPTISSRISGVLKLSLYVTVTMRIHNPSVVAIVGWFDHPFF